VGGAGGSGSGSAKEVKYPIPSLPPLLHSGVFAAASRVGEEDDAPTGGPLDPAFDDVWGAAEEDVQQALLEGGGADAYALEALLHALLDALELGDEEKGVGEE